VTFIKYRVRIQCNTTAQKTDNQCYYSWKNLYWKSNKNHRHCATIITFVHSCAIFCVRRSLCHLSPSVPVFSQSLNFITSSYFFFYFQCITSFVHVLLGWPLVFFPSNFLSRTNKALRPAQPLITCPALCQ